MKTFTVTKNDAEKRLDKFVTKTAPQLPQSLLYKYLRLKRIKVNGRKAEISTRLKEGDTVDMYIGDEFFGEAERKYDFMSASKNIDVIYEDENILLLNKKAGLLSHPDEGEYTDTLITRVTRYLYEKGEYDPAAENSFAPALANRIDRNTGGIVIAAKNAESLRNLNDIIKRRDITKLYLCVCIGKMPEKEGVLGGWLFKDEKRNTVTVTKKQVPGSKEIRTKYTVLGYRNGLSLCEVDLLTGRTHQIRAHFASVGHPLLGDGKYGTNEQNRSHGGYKKQFLYSYKLIFKKDAELENLSYLAGREFTAPEVWFESAFKNGELK